MGFNSGFKGLTSRHILQQSNITHPSVSQSTSSHWRILYQKGSCIHACRI